MSIGNNKDIPMKDCLSCNGKGEVKCPACQGKGRPFDCSHCGDIEKTESWGFVPCNRCNGTGKVNRG